MGRPKKWCHSSGSDCPYRACAVSTKEIKSTVLLRTVVDHEYVTVCQKATILKLFSTRDVRWLSCWNHCRPQAYLSSIVLKVIVCQEGWLSILLKPLSTNEVARPSYWKLLTKRVNCQLSVLEMLVTKKVNWSSWAHHWLRKSINHLAENYLSTKGANRPSCWKLLSTKEVNRPSWKQYRPMKFDCPAKNCCWPKVWIVRGENVVDQWSQSTILKTIVDHNDINDRLTKNCCWPQGC